MEYRRLGRSGLLASEIGLGTNNFGTRLDDSGAGAVLAAARDHGVTLIDTADYYGQGRSEEQIGRLLGNDRQNMILATKFGKPMGESPSQRGASRRWITLAIEASLRRLRSDYIDLYQVHEADGETPVLETIQALDDAVRAGKIRYYGTSNFASWQLVDAQWTAQTERLVRPISAQYVWNILERDIELEVLPAVEHLGLGLIAARPLAYGFLTGKYADGGASTAGRLVGSVRQDQIMTADNFDALRRLDVFSRERHRSLIELALGRVLSEPTVSSVLVSASSVDQLSQDVAGSRWRLDRNDLEQLNQALSPP